MPTPDATIAPRSSRLWTSTGGNPSQKSGAASNPWTSMASEKASTSREG